MRYVYSVFLLFLIPFYSTAQYVNFEDTWNEFLTNNKTSNISELVKPAKQDAINYAKYCLMYANTHFCAADVADAEDMMFEIARLEKEQYEAIPGFSDRQSKMERDISAYHKVDRAWTQFMSDRSVTIEALNELESVSKVCEKGTLAKLNYMLAYQHYCKGDVAEASKYFMNRVKKLVENTTLKTTDVEGFTPEYQLMKSHFEGLKKVGQAWKTFKESGESPGFDEKDLPEIACYPIPSMKAYILIAAADLCGRGAEMLANIERLEEGNQHPPKGLLAEKIDWLKSEVGKYTGDTGTLRKAWTNFLPKDTLLEPVELAEFYCKKIDQVKSWIIKGHLNQCPEGQDYLDKIDAFQKEHELSFDEELDCRIHRLRIKVWDCRYWEIVRQAQKETHEERERFGPESTLKMKADLNSDQLPCETTVEYDSLGYIGVQYIITTFLCQDVDLAKMGDPEYYKKIADWVRDEVLQAYCEPNLRCKKDFYIYLEGHTDGNAFRGASYRNSLDIPEGTPFTHFTADTSIALATEREITKSLKSNMELGIARAWTVKQQLEFMEVPITIGAYEHPASEKGGEYRRIEIELNITNLMLDFYEKRLNELLEASGIGDRPANCA
ncbi:MAG: hypothetical protein AAF598_02520 [Bacteroidota bacterium]